MTQLHQQLLTLLKELQEEDTFILVEGKNDRAALESLGIYNVIMINRRPLFKVVESLLQEEVKEIVILTDFDHEGRKLYRRLNHECSQRGIKVNNKLRHFLMRKTSLGQVEGLPSFLGHQKEKVELTLF